MLRKNEIEFKDEYVFEFLMMWGGNKYHGALPYARPGLVVTSEGVTWSHTLTKPDIGAAPTCCRG